MEDASPQTADTPKTPVSIPEAKAYQKKLEASARLSRVLFKNDGTFRPGTFLVDGDGELTPQWKERFEAMRDTLVLANEAGTVQPPIEPHALDRRTAYALLDKYPDEFARAVLNESNSQTAVTSANLEGGKYLQTIMAPYMEGVRTLKSPRDITPDAAAVPDGTSMGKKV